MSSCRICIVLVSLSVIAAGWASQASASEFSFRASVDKTRLELEETLLLTVSVSGTGITNVGEPELPPMADFDVLGRSSSQSSQFSITNGKISSRKTIDYSYTLKPRKTGELTIGSAKVSFKGKDYRTEPVKVRVTEASVSQKQPDAQPPSSLPERELFLDSRIDKTSVFVGEQISIDYSLYVAIGLSNVRLGNIPSYAGFWSEEVFSAKRLDFKTRVVKGRRFDVAPIRSVALFPTSAGEFDVEPMTIVCDVPTRSRDPFRDFWGATRTVTVKSSPITIEVKDLPRSGRVDSFSGAVGTFEFGMDVSAETVSVGEPIEITTKVSGAGNIRTLEVPELPEIEGFKTYEPEVSIDVSKSGGKISGAKTHTYMVVPNSQGGYVIPSLRFTFFSPEDKRYHVISTDEVALHVEPGGAGETFVDAGRGPIQILGRDILYIKPDLRRLRGVSVHLYQRVPFLFLQVIPAIALLFTVIYERHRRRIEADTAYARSRRARGLASARLKGARSLLRAGELSQVVPEVARAVTKYVGDRINVNPAGLTLDRMLHELRSRGVPEEVLGDFKDCMNRCDLLRFASRELDGDSAEDLIDTAESTIGAFEERPFR
jgi:hypothetical protein